VLEAHGRPSIDITATPCRLGPPLSRPLAGDVIAFALRWDGPENGVLWISSDTVLYDVVRRVAERLRTDTALLHLGGVRFPVTGPVRYTMTAKDSTHAPPSITRAGSTSSRVERRSRWSSRVRQKTYAGALVSCLSASRWNSPVERGRRRNQQDDPGAGPAGRAPLFSSSRMRFILDDPGVLASGVERVAMSPPHPPRAKPRAIR